MGTPIRAESLSGIMRDGRAPHYDAAFFDHTDYMALKSARILLPIIGDLFPIRSVVDFGCGSGGWLKVWKELGVFDCVGVDGDYLDQQRLLIEPSEFVAADLTRPVKLQRRFDLVQSLEVAEHLPTTAAATFVDTLIAHGDIILFSAAPPGDGGLHHINERPYGYWRDLFADYGYDLLDAVRPKIRTAMNVEPWYRYNTFLFVKRSAFDALDDALKASRVPKTGRVPDLSPVVYKFRKLMLRPLPVSAVDLLSRLKARLSRRRNK